MSPDSVEPTLRAFAVCGRHTANIGYCDASTGRVTASVEIPTQVIERAVLENTSVEITLLSDGEITSAVASTASDRLLTKTSAPVDQLVEAFLSSKNLFLEEATEAELRTLLERLQKSVRDVERTIANLESVAK